jgi:hypothetical protein
LAGALLLAGCAARLDPVEKQGGETPVSFSAGSSLLRDDSPATKAEAYPAGTSFGVFAYKGNMNGPNNNLAPGFMYNVEVAHDGSTYTYSPIRFWPAVTEKLTFWAYSPYTASPILYKAGTTTAFTPTTKTIPDIQYTADGQTDFMVSDVVKNQTKNSNSGLVVMPFNHALSKVDVNVKKKDPTLKYTVTLKNVSFNGIYHTGIIRWDASLETCGQRQKLSVCSDDIVLTSDNHALPAVLPLPQSLADASARLHVEFSVSYEGILHERSTTCEVLLSRVFEDAGAAWSKNSHYTLNITISPDDPIEFTVSWSDWGDV